MTRREALGLLLLAACSRTSRPAPRAAGSSGLPRPPMVDLAPAAGLLWLVDARLRELLASPALAGPVAEVVPPDRFAAFAAQHGGVDLRRVDELVIAAYPETTLALARVPLDPARVEAAFGARTAVFGREALAVERGRPGPLGAAVYFAQGKLRRSLPALRAEPLAGAAALLGDAPLRAFAPGPFTGPWASGLGGLIGAATAAALAANVTPDGSLGVRFLLTGAWGTDASAAADRLGSELRLLMADPVARLAGIGHPLGEPRISGRADALHVELALSPAALARGLHALGDATVPR